MLFFLKPSVVQLFSESFLIFFLLEFEELVLAVFKQYSQRIVERGVAASDNSNKLQSLYSVYTGNAFLMMSAL